LKGDGLAKAIGPVSGLPEVKYSGVRGGVRRLFGVDLMRGLETVLMVEGEFDCMLGWQELGDLADVVTLGGASGGLRLADGVYLLRARRILAAYDADEAGQKGGKRLAALSERVTVVTPPGKDLTEAWRASGAYGLRAWFKGLQTGR
jgi:DNA primase